jgi:hypothetical protein
MSPFSGVDEKARNLNREVYNFPEILVSSGFSPITPLRALGV